MEIKILNAKAYPASGETEHNVLWGTNDIDVCKAIFELKGLKDVSSGEKIELDTSDLQKLLEKFPPIEKPTIEHQSDDSKEPETTTVPQNMVERMLDVGEPVILEILYIDEF